MVAFGPCIIVLSLIGMVMDPVPNITNIISQILSQIVTVDLKRKINVSQEMYLKMVIK
jgi:hypothetical protein